MEQDVSAVIEQIKKSVAEGKTLIKEGRQKLEDYKMTRQTIEEAFKATGIESETNSE